MEQRLGTDEPYQEINPYETDNWTDPPCSGQVDKVDCTSGDQEDATKAIFKGI
jgi:hypothetical protein